MRALVNLSGVTVGKRLAMRKANRKYQKDKKPAWTKATTTYLVQNVFETFFTDQLDKENDKEKAVRLLIKFLETLLHPNIDFYILRVQKDGDAQFAWRANNLTAVSASIAKI